MLAQYLDIGRETTDADFLVRKLKAELKTISDAVNEIISISLEDGFSFTFESSVELQQPHMGVCGFRMILGVGFEKMRDKIQIDIGIGDVVEPIEEEYSSFQYKGKPIFEGEITLMVYPIESFFAEKLQTIISKGSANSRMKDYHDLLLIMREDNLLKTEKLTNAVRKTFSHRGTQPVFPIKFTEFEILGLDVYWNNHLRGLGKIQDRLKLPLTLLEALNEINSWLAKYYSTAE